MLLEKAFHFVQGKLASKTGSGLRSLTPSAKLHEILEQLHPQNSGHDLVRIGAPGDGGYLVPNDLDGIVACFSPGVAENTSFEEEISELMPVFLADASVESLPHHVDNCLFEQIFVKSRAGKTSTTLHEWVSKNAPLAGDLLLQMDIEGDEYEVLMSAPTEILKRFRIMVIEFHFLDGLFFEREQALIASAFSGILQSHSVVHIHPNNCCGTADYCGIEIPRVAEFTFLRNDRFRSRSFRSDFPHPLDNPNTLGPDLVLPTSLMRESS